MSTGRVAWLVVGASALAAAYLWITFSLFFVPAEAEKSPLIREVVIGGADRGPAAEQAERELPDLKPQP